MQCRESIVRKLPSLYQHTRPPIITMTINSSSKKDCLLLKTAMTKLGSNSHNRSSSSSSISSMSRKGHRSRLVRSVTKMTPFERL